MILHRVAANLCRICRVPSRRYASHVERPPLPPPSPIKNLGEYIEPSIMAREHTPAMYREANIPSATAYKVATGFGIFVWTWILLGLYYEFDHITGHHPWPNPKSWTDEELGIPKDLQIE